MRSGKRRPSPGKPSSSGSRRDVLYDQLLRSLTGDNSVATQGEVIRWAHEQDRVERKVPLIDPQAPWPIQRGQALTLLQAVPWADYLYAEQVRREAWEIDLLEQDTAPLLPLDEDPLKTDWLQWRNGLIQDYQLEGLVPENPTTSSL